MFSRIRRLGNKKMGGKFNNSTAEGLEVLNQRLDARVDAMISQGLVEELLDFKAKCVKENIVNDAEYDFTQGVLQTIGFKEFNEYLSSDETVRDTEEGTKLLKNGIELLKIATRQYAKRQNKWVLNRWMKNSRRQVPPVYSLDTTDPSKWKENVYEKAASVVEARLAGRTPDVDPLPVAEGRVPVDKCYHCEICNRYLMGKGQWEQHIKGAKHRKTCKGKEKRGRGKLETWKEAESSQDHQVDESVCSQTSNS